MHRQAIKNSTFLNGYDIGKAVADLSNDHNRKRRLKQAQSVYRRKHRRVYITVNITTGQHDMTII
jgi:hypothetical protein